MSAFLRFLRALLRLLARLFSQRPPNPGSIHVTIKSEDRNMLTFDINLPTLPAEPNDIASGELNITVGSGGLQTIGTTKDQTTVSGLSGEQGDQVEASFVYIDDAGNRSTTPSTLSVILTDTLPPADPGSLGLTVTAES